MCEIYIMCAHDIIAIYDINVMFQAHPTLHRDYGTVGTVHDDKDWEQLVDISMYENNSLIDTATRKSTQMLSANDIRKIVQVTTNEIIALDKIHGLNNQYMKFAITIVYQSLHDHVRPAVSESQMKRLIVGTTEKLITHYHHSAHTRERLMGWLADDVMGSFIQQIVTQPHRSNSVVGEGRENEKDETGCFVWFWNLFR